MAVVKAAEKTRNGLHSARHVCAPHVQAVSDAAVVYIVLLETAKGLLIFGGFATFIIVAMGFIALGSEDI